MFLNMRYMPAMHHAVKCQGAASYHAFSQRVHAGSPTSSWCGLGSCGSHQLDRSRSPKMHCIHLLRIIGERERANLLTGTIYPALMYAVMFYVILNKRKRLGDCVTFSYPGALSGTYQRRLDTTARLHNNHMT